MKRDSVLVESLKWDYRLNTMSDEQ